MGNITGRGGLIRSGAYWKEGLSMITVKCTYSSGDIITTRFNGTFQEAESYFLNQIFNIGTVYDNMQKCIRVEEYCEGHTGCISPEVAGFIPGR